jgi:hypothetical protein
MERIASHISHVAFNSASDAFVDGTALGSGERIGVDIVDGDEGCAGGWSWGLGNPEAERGDELD